MSRSKSPPARRRQPSRPRSAWLSLRVESLEERQMLSVSPFAHYDMGTPTLTDIWVDPTGGNDAHSGTSRSAALRTLNAAWDRVPSGATLGTTGYRIMLAPGTYQQDAMPTWWDDRHGAFQCPIVIQAADGLGTVTLAAMDLHDVHYLYLIGLRLEAAGGGGDVLHFASSDHVLIRDTQLVGIGSVADSTAPQETLKINQAQYVYIEDSDISGATWAAVDYVAVQYGHVIGSAVHRAGDWAMYVKGGSAYIDVEGNQFYDAATGGFSAGQGTGFEFMVSPWLHYEAYDIKVVNNVVHDTDGAGLGVNGGYDILMAYNTLYRVGSVSHAIEVVHGLRSADGNDDLCRQYLAAGGWGTADGGHDEPIPNKHVFIYDNIVYNPFGYQSQWQQFAIQGAATPSAGTNIPNPSRADDDLRIRGNIIWNGPPDLPLGIEGQSVLVTTEQLRADNAINQFEPQLVDPAHGDFRPVAGGNVTTYGVLTPPDFSWSDAPSRPLAPAGNLSNAVATDYNGNSRGVVNMPGAFDLGAAAQTFVLSGPTSGSYHAGDSVTIAWTAGGVVAGNKISLCYDRDTTWWNGNETWIEIDQVAAANGSGSYTWNTTGVAPGTYYVAGYLWSGTSAVFSHLMRSITVTAAATPTFGLSGPTSGTFTVGQSVPIQWMAGNVGAGSKISLCYDADNIWWNGNEHWIEVDQVTAANGGGSYSWNTTGVTPGTYYVAGYLWSDGRPAFSHLNQPITIQATTPPSPPTFVLSAPTSGNFTAGQTVPIRWTASNVGVGGKISLCYDRDQIWWNGNETWIEIDQVTAANGAGVYNWNTTGIRSGTYYVAGYLWSNGSPTFSHLSRSISVAGSLMVGGGTTPRSSSQLPAVDRAELLGAVMREMGDVLGYDHTDDGGMTDYPAYPASCRSSFKSRV